MPRMCWRQHLCVTIRDLLTEPDCCSRAFVLSGAFSAVPWARDLRMRDKKDNATFDLPGFSPAAPLEPEAKRTPGVRVRRASLKQVQLELLDPTGLPIWAPAL